MSAITLFKEIVTNAARASLFGTVESALDVAGSAILPGAWPILKGALEPVLERLAQRLEVKDVTESPDVADRAVSEFEKDTHLQALLESNLLRALEPVLKSQKRIAEDVQKLGLVALGNFRLLVELTGGTRRIEEMLLKGVVLSEDLEQSLHYWEQQVGNSHAVPE